MYSKFLKDCVVKTTDSLYEVYWRGRHNDSMLCVLDDKDKFVGIIGWSQINELDCVPPRNRTCCCNRHL